MSERTSGAVEGWNRILKCIDHPRHRLRPDVFIHDHWQPLTGRQLTYIDQPVLVSLEENDVAEGLLLLLRELMKTLTQSTKVK